MSKGVPEYTKTPECCWSFLCIHYFLKEHSWIQQLIKMKQDLHDELCRYYNLEKEEVSSITGNIPDFPDGSNSPKSYLGWDLHTDLRKLEMEKRKREKEYDKI